jgi:NAD(P)-dependent dehydrogenase (short-subunit alcohol dehydrogenase family)
MDNAVAIVTGGSRGIGLAVARRLVEHGAKVCITARDPEVLAKAAVDLGAPQRVEFVPGRVDDPELQDAVIARTMEVFGRVDMLVNNTAISPVYGQLVDLDQNLAAKIMAVNALAPLSWTKKSRAAWMGEHGGSVVNIASIAAVRTLPGVGLYGMSKAALIQQTAQLAVELAPRIRVNTVLPAVVRTRMAAVVLEGDGERELAESYPLGRLGEPDDIARAVTFLLSEDAGWITGSALVIDGGVTLGGVM